MLRLRVCRRSPSELGWPLAAGSDDSCLDPSGYGLHLRPADDLGRETAYGSTPLSNAVVSPRLAKLPLGFS
jgi:hypothetical protein